MEEAGLFHADVDECGLHPRQNPRDFSFVNVSRDSHLLFSFDEELGELAVFDDRDAAFLGGGIDENLLFHKTCLNDRAQCKEAGMTGDGPPCERRYLQDRQSNRFCL